MKWLVLIHVLSAIIGVGPTFAIHILLRKNQSVLERYNEVTPKDYRSFGFPGAEDIGNMFQYFQEFEQVLLGARDIDVSRLLNASLQTLDEWLAKNKNRILVE